MTVIELPDELGTELRAKAAAEGLTLDAWFQKIATDSPKRNGAIDWSRCAAVESVSDRLRGAWVFKDTRMPVSAVFENLEAGATIDEIIEQFDITREQINTVLEFATQSAEAPLSVPTDVRSDARSL
ncbi:MAG: DUF433 domain-containing protein [Acidobacteria bacterium]|nr:DUF433 domain-containing protein [Acidobacteriota bacterium]